jgi:hypothetical protein
MGIRYWSGGYKGFDAHNMMVNTRLCWMFFFQLEIIRPIERTRGLTYIKG